MNFDSHINGAVVATVALVNAVTPGWSSGRPVEVPRGPDLAVMSTAALRSGSSRPVPDLTEAGAEHLRGWAGEIRTVVEMADQGQLDEACVELNRLLRASCALPNLARHDGEPWHLHFHEDSADVADGWAAAMATGLAVVLGSPARERLGLCGASACDRVYLDESRNGSRSFCSAGCQNRSKTAAYRKRRREGTATG